MAYMYVHVLLYQKHAASFLCAHVCVFMYVHVGVCVCAWGGHANVSFTCFQVNIVGMEMFSPVRGRLRRTHHDGIHTKFSITKRDYRLYAKMGYVQVGTHIHVCTVHTSSVF